MQYTYLIPTITLIGGFFLGYLTSYLQEKGKNRATIEDTGKITQAQENVLLQSAKRKYQYEDKRTQYFKYFDFFGGYFQAIDDDQKSQYIIKYSTAINEIMFEANIDHLKIKSETSSLKLIAAPKVEALLLETEKAYNDAFNESSELMKEFTELLINEKMDLLEEKQQQLKVTGENLMKLKAKLIGAMKAELDEI